MLVEAAIGVDWPTRDPSVVHEYHKLILDLVSAHAPYLITCVEPIIDRMSLYNRSRDAEKREKPKRTYEPSACLVHAQTFDRLHRLLDGIVRLVPMTSAVVVPLVRQYYPFPQSDAYVVESYVTNVLRMCGYVALRRSELLQFVVEKVLEVDLTAPRDQLKMAAAEEEVEADRSDDDLFAMEDVAAEGKKALCLFLGIFVITFLFNLNYL
jgi:RNA polymerase I-specific transcription initiation factor RRN3